MSFLCYVVKHLFYITSIIVFLRRTASQTGAFATRIKVNETCNRTTETQDVRKLI
jgi:hypothetical protein